MLIAGNIVYLALYRGAGVSMGCITRLKHGSGGKISGFFVAEDTVGETYLSLSRIGELVFMTFQGAVEEILRRNSGKGVKTDA